MDSPHAQALPLEADSLKPDPEVPTTSPLPDALALEKGAAGQEPQANPEPEVAAKPAGADMSTRVLVQAGLSVFGAILLVMLMAMWQINAEAVATMLRSAAGPALLMALAPIGLGLLILRRNKDAETPEPGIIWAKIGIYVGMVLSMVMLMLPAFVTLRSLVNPQAL